MTSHARESVAADVTMRPTLCPLCRTNGFDHEVYARNFEIEAVSAAVFSARRLPDRLHYRMVRCGQCGLLRSDPILTGDVLAALYAKSEFTYAAEAPFTSATYAQYLLRALPLVSQRGRLLEIGCGNGFFLDEAIRAGFTDARGVEPSVAAVRQAPERWREKIQLGLYEVTSYPARHFDVVCGFQVLDHAPDPVALVEACREHLTPGGVALFINHDAGALSARLLGELSPIVDVEHTALFDRRTMRRLFEQGGLAVEEIFAVRNTYPLSYWAKLAPLPAALKRLLLAGLARTRLAQLPLTLSAGNLGLIAVKR